GSRSAPPPAGPSQPPGAYPSVSAFAAAGQNAAREAQNAAAGAAELERAFAAQQQMAVAPSGSPGPMTHQGDDDDDYDLPAGVPKASPRWMVPAVVGALFLLVGGAVVMALLR
ncbi:MAG TPA: hypothetical protein VFS00_32655, partial [Polyangiaceae bacterium]|nr:hypothetical protein [Polyangiaceae bacterium]